MFFLLQTHSKILIVEPLTGSICFLIFKNRSPNVNIAERDTLDRKFFTSSTSATITECKSLCKIVG